MSSIFISSAVHKQAGTAVVWILKFERKLNIVSLVVCFQEHTLQMNLGVAKRCHDAWSFVDIVGVDGFQLFRTVECSYQ
jgi:hypothetical protein